MSALLILAATTLLQYSTECVDNRLRGADPSAALSRFSFYPAGANFGKFVSNDRFWAKGMDFSCASPWNDRGGSLRAGTLISKRHIIYARHFPIAAGARILFVGSDGEVCPCYLEKSKRVERTDIMIGLLNAEVTPNIQPAKILPTDYERYIGNGSGFPIVTFNQREQLSLTEANALPTNSAAYLMTCHVPMDERRSLFRVKIDVGDSGNPAFLLVGDKPILLYCIMHGVCGSGKAIHTYREEIQSVMDELCPGYKLECFDFSEVGYGK